MIEGKKQREEPQNQSALFLNIIEQLTSRDWSVLPQFLQTSIYNSFQLHFCLATVRVLLKVIKDNVYLTSVWIFKQQARPSTTFSENKGSLTRKHVLKFVFFNFVFSDSASQALH